MKKYFSFCLFFSALFIMAQENYNPIDTANRTIRESQKIMYENRAKVFQTLLKEKIKDSKKYSYVKDNYNEVNEEFNKDLLKNRYIFNDSIQKMVNSIAQTIIDANPQIPKNLNFYISRDIGLNAYCMGNGNFIFNLGTFYYMDNEDQIAVIISHEIAHLLLDHVIEGQLDNYQMYYSNEAKNKLKDISKTKKNQSENAFKLFKNLLYEDKAKHRKIELQADSLGYALYKKTKYAQSEFINALKLMEEYDTIKPMGLDSTIYAKVFNLPNAPFKQKWLEREDFSSYHYQYKSKIDEDSIATHPEIDKRIKHIQAIYPELKELVKEKEASTEFKKIEYIAKMERQPSLYITEDYGAGIYICLLRLQNPEEKNKAYYEKWLGHYFQKIYESRKNYTLNRYLDRIDPEEQDDSYQLFLNFMWNLSLEDIQHITDYYTEK